MAIINALLSLTPALSLITWWFPLLVLTLLAYYLETYTKYKTNWKKFLVATIITLFYPLTSVYQHMIPGEILSGYNTLIHAVLFIGTLVGAYYSIRLLRFQNISLGKTKITMQFLGLIGTAIPLSWYLLKRLDLTSLINLILHNLALVFLVVIYLTIAKISRSYIAKYSVITYGCARGGSLVLLFDPISENYLSVADVGLEMEHVLRFMAVISHNIANIILLFVVGMLIHEAKTRGLHLMPKRENKKGIPLVYRLKGGYSYLVKEEIPKRSFDIFVDLLSQGQYGLCITRTRPETIRKRFGLRTTPMLWMTDAQTDEKSIKPTDLDRLLLISKDFIKTSGDAVILLQRLDYLITQNGYDKSLRFIQSLNDIIMSSDCTLLVSINPSTLTKEQFALLTQELTDLDIARRITLSESSYDLLNFINSENKHNRMPSFVDVARKFSITKTTARKRILELENKGLMRIIKEGRYKLLEVTERGKDLLSGPMGPVNE